MHLYERTTFDKDEWITDTAELILFHVPPRSRVQLQCGSDQPQDLLKLVIRQIFAFSFLLFAISSALLSLNLLLCRSQLGSGVMYF